MLLKHLQKNKSHICLIQVGMSTKPPKATSRLNTSNVMPQNAGHPGYGSVLSADSGISGSADGLETGLVSETEEQASVSWRPLTMEELEAAAGGVGWRKVRSCLVLLFWLVWLVLLGTSIAIIVKNPNPTATHLQWWQKSLFYQLPPVVLIGTHANEPGYIIVAVSKHLAYLKSLGVGVVIMEGLFHKGSSDLVVNYELLTVPQIQHLVKENNNIGIPLTSGLKVVLDLCEVDLAYGTFTGNGTDMPPESSTSEYAFQFWLEQGVSGFAICDADAEYSDKTLLAWRELLSQYSSQDDERIIIVKQRTGLRALNTSSAINVTLEVVLRSILPPANYALSAQEMAAAVEMHLQIMGATIWPIWTVGGKVANYRLQKLLLVLIMTLPGSPAVHYGDEINAVEDKKNVSHSALDLLISLSRLRAREAALLYGTFTRLRFNTTSVSSSNSTLHDYPPSSPILAFLRSWGCSSLLIVLNLGPEPLGLDPAWVSSLPDAGVFVTSTGMNRRGSTSLGMLALKPQEAIVLKLFTDSYS